MRVHVRDALKVVVLAHLIVTFLIVRIIWFVLNVRTLLTLFLKENARRTARKGRKKSYRTINIFVRR